MRALPLLLIALFPLGLPAAEALDLAPVKKWIAKQSDFRAVVADFKQTRSLRALRSPLASTGRLWFAAPNSFRWEVGEPAKTVVLRKGDTIHVIQPEKKKAERSLAGKGGKPSPAQAFAMMQFPLATDWADFQRQFEVLAVETEGTRCHLEVLPRDPQARKFLNALKMDFNTSNGQLLSFELATKDGSSLRNEFSNVQVNPKIDRAVFEYDLTGYKVVDARQ
ncbi:MAG TPA: outer membrane lipoprotein carrier protein LolA [Chthoniobacteraceae bacterium]|jgi:outer membrane lipoprotein-sorting protein|nr:outer membrane lipoprotein carrier protein LolA [Chthoniobacteraceae bacterium]